MLMKKAIIFFIIICIGFLGCQKVKHHQPDHITLSWADDPHTTQTFTWRTDTTVINGEVQFTMIEDSLKFGIKKMRVKEDSCSKFITDIGSWNIHTITIKGLIPGKAYCYRVGYGDSWSSISTFLTESKEVKSFRFLIFGDSQSGDPADTNYTMFDKTIHNAYKANPNSKFFINMGDLVETSGYYRHWNNWFEAVKDIINKIPIMPVIGNHETYYDSLESKGKPINFIMQFHLPQQKVPAEFKGQIYSYDYGNVHFTVWDSQIEEEKPDQVLLNKELNWLNEDLENTNKTWKVLLFHKTPYYNKRTRSNDSLKSILQPIIDSNHVDLVINGHDHGVSWTYPVKNDKFSNKPSQGTIYYTAGRSGNKKYPDLNSKIWDAFFINPRDMPNYVVADVNKNIFTLKAYYQDGRLIDSLTIDKSKDEVFPFKKIPEKFKETRLVVFGSLMADSFNPVKKDAIWYIPAKIFIEYIHGNLNKRDNILVINIGNDIAEFNIKHFQQNKHVDMISTVELKAKFGFIYKYDETLNMLLLSKDEKH
jgi:acid phosphatase type 7